MDDVMGVNLMKIQISTTTGSNFEITIEDDTKTIEHLKKLVSKRLKVPSDRFQLIYSNRELQEGTIRENGLIDGSKIILTPNVETGLLAQRAENTVMQALESLNDAQVNDFLSGKSPLNLSVRLGDHMMLIQLQLSTLNPTSTSTALPSTSAAATAALGNAKAKSLTRSKTISTNTTSGPTSHSFYGESSKAGGSLSSSSSSSSFRRYHSADLEAGPKITEIVNTLKTDDDYDSIEVPTTFVVEDDESKQSANFSDLDTLETADSLLDQSPIKSLSNLVSGPIKTTPIIRNNVVPVPRSNFATSSPIFEPTASGSTSMCTDPISANLTSCLCKRLDNSSSCDIDSCQHQTSTVSSSGYLSATSPTSPLHRTLNGSIVKPKLRSPQQQVTKAFLRKTLSAESLASTVPNSPTSIGTLSLPTTPDRTTTPPPTADSMSANNTIDNTALAEASRNLTQTLRKLSKRCFPNKIDITEDNSRKQTSAGKSSALASTSQGGATNASGAVIESMKHHGKGIYSGTFSGTLNPALQDKYGRPKRDISTIIHILNDLLSAAPQCARSGAKIIFEPATPNHSSVQSTTGTTPQPSTSGRYTPKTTPMSNASSSPHRYQSPSCTKACTYDSSGHYNTSPMLTRKTNIFSNIDHHHSPPSHSSISAVRRLNESFDESSNANRHVYTPISGGAVTSTAPHSHCKCHQMGSSSTTTVAGNPILTAFEMESRLNNVTKCKVDQLRLVMQQKKERREARKLKTPYSAGARVAACGVGDLLPNLALASTSAMHKTTAATDTAGPAAGNTSSTMATTITTAPSESSPNCIVEEVDTVA